VADKVTFTSGSADRIAKVVRIVEAGNRDASVLPTSPRFGQTPAGSPVRFAMWTATTNWTVATVTAATTTNNTKVIQFAFPLATRTEGTATITFSAGFTATCINHLAGLPLLTTVATATQAVQVILVTKEAGAWRLIGAQA
jgi:hypothetical protein